MSFFDHKDLGNHLLQLCPKVVKHPVYWTYNFTLWDPRSVLCLLQYEIEKSGLMVADSYKIILGLWCDLDRASSLICGNKMPTRCNRRFFADLIACSTTHHTDNLKTKAPNTTGSNHLYNTLELLVMDIVVPKTCWASNKICKRLSIASSWHFISTYFRSHWII
jgi:hypothetical protein